MNKRNGRLSLQFFCFSFLHNFPIQKVENSVFTLLFWAKHMRHSDLTVFGNRNLVLSYLLTLLPAQLSSIMFQSKQAGFILKQVNKCEIGNKNTETQKIVPHAVFAPIVHVLKGLGRSKYLYAPVPC